MSSKTVAFLGAVVFSLLAVLSLAEEAVLNEFGDVIQAAQSIGEARGRATLLHETIHGSLQVMHRDFFVE